jgi:hypothetical protein
MIAADMIILTPANNWRKWNGREWLIAEYWSCHICTGKFEFHLNVKPGFPTDGGSIPKIFQNIISPLGCYLLAFLVHDILYAGEFCTRTEADWILLELLEYLGASWIRRNEIYSAVRIGGSFVWAGHTKENIQNAEDLITFTPIKGFEQLNPAGCRRKQEE